MSNEQMKDKFSKEISNKINSSNLRQEVKKWLDSEISYLSSVVARYTEHPEMIEISEDTPKNVAEERQRLRQNPLLIIDTILFSADQLFEYQDLYKKSIIAIANAFNLITQAVSFEDLPRKIEEVSLAKGKNSIDKYMKDGDKLVIPILGIGGTGKGTIIKMSGIPRVVNHTTRPKRPGEIEGIDYDYVLGVDLKGNKEINGKLVDYHEELNGPFVADLIREGRGRYSTSVKAINDSFAKSSVVFVEQSPEQVKVIGEKVPELMDSVRVIPVCILPPGSGILELATRVVVRTYGDPVHQDMENNEGYKIEDSYLTSTVGPGQIAEVAETIEFTKGNNPLGVVYIVNDDLNRAVNQVKHLFGK